MSAESCLLFINMLFEIDVSRRVICQCLMRPFSQTHSRWDRLSHISLTPETLNKDVIRDRKYSSVLITIELRIITHKAKSWNLFVNHQCQSQPSWELWKGEPPFACSSRFPMWRWSRIGAITCRHAGIVSIPSMSMPVILQEMYHVKQCMNRNNRR